MSSVIELACLREEDSFPRNLNYLKLLISYGLVVVFVDRFYTFNEGMILLSPS